MEHTSHRTVTTRKPPSLRRHTFGLSGVMGGLSPVMWDGLATWSARLTLTFVVVVVGAVVGLMQYGHAIEAQRTRAKRALRAQRRREHAAQPHHSCDCWTQRG